ncbi:MAG: hypothetical protein ACE37F_19330 [Nannocystaceae bacterium]|nr:hypothetical protein [bacterium]
MSFRALQPSLSLATPIALLLLACDPGGSGDGGDAGSTGSPDPSSTGGGEDSSGDDGSSGEPPTTGNAGLTFRPLLGSGAKEQFDAAARPLIPEDTSTDRGDLLILLCDVGDTACEDPIIRLVDKDDESQWPADVGGPAPIQKSFGPQIAVSDLPAGSYALTVVYDSLDSQRRGYGWQDDFDTNETAWGGVVSETDLMLAEATPTSGQNPPPVTMEVTLVDDQTLDLGDLVLAHYHERAISSPPAADDGIVVVGNKTDNAMRIIDLSTYTVEPQGVGVDVPLVDADGQEIMGSMCNVIEGPGSTVYALFTSSGMGIDEAGFAAQFDVQTREQVGGLVTFPRGTSQAGPCRAVWHAHEGNDYLFAVAADSTNQGNNRGFWYANVSELDAGDVDATIMTLADDQLFDQPLMNVAAWQGEVYIGTTTDDLPECEGATCLYIADFDASGRPSLRSSGGERSLYRAGTLRGDVTVTELDAQTVSCADVEQGVNYFGLSVETFKKTQTDYLVVGNCHSVEMIDLAAGEVVDFDDAQPGVQGLVGALYGGGFYDFDLSPDGNTLWAVPANKSRFVHYPVANEPMGDLGGGRVTIDRHALMPIDLGDSAPGNLPSIDASWGADRDGFEGLPDDGIQDYATPGFDPGIDVRGAFLKMYYLFWNRSLSGSLPNPFPVGPSIAVANNTVWLRGAGADLGDEGPSGLGVGGNLSVLDLDAQRLVLWPRTPEADYYRPFVGLKQFNFGFDLTPDSESSIATAGILYMDL